MAPAIRVLLLDLGNVTVRLRTREWLERAAQACRPPRGPEAVMAFLQRPDGPHHRQERGLASGADVHRAMVEQLGFALDYPAWLALWQDFFGPNRPMEALLGRLRGQVRLWGLSNTNTEHLAHFKLNFRVAALFEGITASHEVGAAKPEPAIYRAALASLNVEPHQVLYLDDVEAYVEAGRALGLRGFHYTFNDDALRAQLLSLGLELPPLPGASALRC